MWVTLPRPMLHDGTGVGSELARVFLPFGRLVGAYRIGATIIDGTRPAADVANAILAAAREDRPDTASGMVAGSAPSRAGTPSAISAGEGTAQGDAEFGDLPLGHLGRQDRLRPVERAGPLVQFD